MKVSRYNFFCKSKYNNQYIAYNSLNSALALIEKQDYKIYKEFEKENKDIQKETLLKDLQKGGFIIEDNVNEENILEYRLWSSRFNKSILSLTLAPTSDCNFRCVYCYEKESLTNKFMDDKTQENIIKFIEDKIETLEVLDITWYGGEPLLAINIIEKLSRKFLEVCKEHEVKYNASMVTNGYKLTPDNVRILNECQIKGIQITIDGMEEIHDQRRFLVNGEGTFKSIIKNLIENKNSIPQVSLRVNIDRENIEVITQIRKLIEENNLEKKVFPYIAPVENRNSCYDEKSCLEVKEFAELECGFVGRGTKILNKYPKQVTHYCGADYIYHFVVDAEGNFYKCWSDIGILEKRIFNVNRINTKIEQDIGLYTYMLYNPVKDMKCRMCKFLPICMGGCPKDIHDNNKHKCSRYKYTLKNYLNMFAEQIKQSKEL